MNRKKYEAPLHGRARKKFDEDSDEEDEVEEEEEEKKSVSTSTGRRARTTNNDKDDSQYIDGKDFFNLLQKKKSIRQTSTQSKNTEDSSESENVPEEKKAGRRFLRDRPTRKKGAVEYFSAELDDDEIDSLKRSQLKEDSLSEEMKAKKAAKDAKFKRLQALKETDKRYRD